MTASQYIQRVQEMAKRSANEATDAGGRSRTADDVYYALAYLNGFLRKNPIGREEVGGEYLVGKAEEVSA